MICDQGIDVLAINLDAKPAMCVIKGKADGKSQACSIDAWFQNGVEKPLQSHVLADYFTITVHGFDKDGDEASSRYDIPLQGIGPEIYRDAYGRFTERAGERMEKTFTDTAARLPATFDKEGA